MYTTRYLHVCTVLYFLAGMCCTDTAVGSQVLTVLYYTVLHWTVPCTDTRTSLVGVSSRVCPVADYESSHFVLEWVLSLDTITRHCC